jgi:hypothetical protein
MDLQQVHKVRSGGGLPFAGFPHARNVLVNPQRSPHPGARIIKRCTGASAVASKNVQGKLRNFFTKNYVEKTYPHIRHPKAALCEL